MLETRSSKIKEMKKAKTPIPVSKNPIEPGQIEPKSDSLTYPSTKLLGNIPQSKKNDNAAKEQQETTRQNEKIYQYIACGLFIAACASGLAYYMTRKKV